MDNSRQKSNYKKFLNNQLASSEMSELNDWIHSTEFDQYAQDIWDESSEIDFELSKQTQRDIYFKIGEEIKIEKDRTIRPINFYRHNFSLLMKIAAVVIFILLSTFVAKHILTDIPRQVETVVLTPKGGRSKTILPDGTEVWMNSDSKISYQPNFDGDERIIALEGEAFFKVVKDATKPFIVKTAGYDVKVHGTAFKVSHYSNSDSRVDLVEGKVEVIGKGKYRTFLKPHESIIYDAKNSTFRLGHNQISEEFDKESANLVFQDESLKAILISLERHYGVKFQVKEEAILSRKFTGTFSLNESLDHILDVMSSNNIFWYKRNGNLLTIY